MNLIVSLQMYVTIKENIDYFNKKNILMKIDHFETNR